MMRWNHIADGENKDLFNRSIEWYHEVADSFESTLPDPIISTYEINGKKLHVAREDMIPCGFKARAAELAIKNIPTKTLAYVAPAEGHAAYAVAYMAKKYDKEVVFFGPARKHMTVSQAKPMLLGNSRYKWIRIAAMPVLNKYCKEWAEDNDATFLPFGLSGMPEVTAGIVKAAKKYVEVLGKNPTEVWSVASTGTMTRGLQIGMPEVETFFAVPVARNMKHGELGHASIYEEPKAFLQKEDLRNLPPFPSVANYDAKGWKYFAEHARDGALFVNVAKDPDREMELTCMAIASKINSQREWHDMSDMETP